MNITTIHQGGDTWLATIKIHGREFSAFDDYGEESAVRLLMDKVEIWRRSPEWSKRLLDVDGVVILSEKTGIELARGNLGAISHEFKTVLLHIVDRREP